MLIRWGLGPVFASEWLTTTRRWQVYAGRSLFVGVLLAGLGVVWWSHDLGHELPTIRHHAWVAQAFFNAIIVTQLVLVLMVAPAATAGAISQDKARGNLAQLLVTDLSNTEIVLGKLAARLVPTLALVACALPVLAIGSLLGGIDPMALTGAFAITTGLAILGCTLALTLSIWGTRPHEVLLATYAFWAVWLLANPVWEHLSWLSLLGSPPDWFRKANPFRLAFGPYLEPGTVGLADYLIFLLATSTISIGLVVLSASRLRAVAARQADGPTRRRRDRTSSEQTSRWWSGPTLDRNPVLWREWHRRRPTLWARALLILYFGLAAGFSLLAIHYNLRWWSDWRGVYLSAYVNAFQVALGIPLLLVASASSLIEERAVGQLDVLMTTPISTRTIVLSKWWAATRWVPWLALLPGLVAASLAWRTGHWLGVEVVVGLALTGGATMTGLGLALATWVSRHGRAVAWGVVLCVLIGLAWPITVANLVSSPLGPGLASLSPFYAQYYVTVGIGERSQGEWMSIDGWGMFWMYVQLVATIGFPLATLATFDRCLGRIPDRPRRPPSDHLTAGP